MQQGFLIGEASSPFAGPAGEEGGDAVTAITDDLGVDGVSTGVTIEEGIVAGGIGDGDGDIVQGSHTALEAFILHHVGDEPSTSFVGPNDVFGA